MFSLAMDEELIERNPFRGLMRKPKGRADEAPPTDAEFGKLLKACAVLGRPRTPDALAAGCSPRSQGCVRAS